MSEPTETFSGVDAIVDRMKRFPQEFFSTEERWRFIYKEYFKDMMTEGEKGRIHDAMKVVRRMEFDANVLKELFREEKKGDGEKAHGIPEFGRALKGMRHP